MQSIDRPTWRPLFFLEVTYFHRPVKCFFHSRNKWEARDGVYAFCTIKIACSDAARKMVEAQERRVCVTKARGSWPSNVRRASFEISLFEEVVVFLFSANKAFVWLVGLVIETQRLVRRNVLAMQNLEGSGRSKIKKGRARLKKLTRLALE